MVPILYIITGEHVLLREIIQEYVRITPKTLFFQSIEDLGGKPIAQLTQSYFEGMLAKEIQRDHIILKKISDGQSIIIEQWIIGLLSQIRLIDKAKISGLEERVIDQFKMFDAVPKKVLYVSTDIEKWSNESDNHINRNRLSNLSNILNNLELPVETINGEDTINHVKERTLYLLKRSE